MHRPQCNSEPKPGRKEDRAVAPEYCGWTRRGLRVCRDRLSDSSGKSASGDTCEADGKASEYTDRGPHDDTRYNRADGASEEPSRRPRGPPESPCGIASTD